MKNFGGYLSNYSGSDQPEMKLIFLDESNNDIGQSNTLTTLNSSWTMLGMEAIIPPQTRTIQVELKGTRNAGTDNDSYFDELFVYVGFSSGCNPIISNVNQPVILQKALEVFPNPASQSANIVIPESLSDWVELTIIDLKGNKITAVYRHNEQAIAIETSSLASGTYFIRLHSKEGAVGFGKLVVVKK